MSRDGGREKEHSILSPSLLLCKIQPPRQRGPWDMQILQLRACGTSLRMTGAVDGREGEDCPGGQSLQA